MPINGVITDDPDRARAVDRLASRDVGADRAHRQPRRHRRRRRAALANAARGRRQKPIVVVVDGLAASGGYMIALAADQIIAREGTITGSIGVILQTPTSPACSKTLGVTIEAIKSAPLKAVPSRLRADHPRGARRPPACWSTTSTPVRDMVPSAGTSTGAGLERRRRAGLHRPPGQDARADRRHRRRDEPALGWPRPRGSSRQPCRMRYPSFGDLGAEDAAVLDWMGGTLRAARRRKRTCLSRDLNLTVWWPSGTLLRADRRVRPPRRRGRTTRKAR